MYADTKKKYSMVEKSLGYILENMESFGWYMLLVNALINLGVPFLA